jgi:hypothetical protein
MWSSGLGRWKVKFLRFWSKKMTFNFCGFLFLRIENLGTEKKIFVLQEATTEAMFAHYSDH